MKEVYIIVPIYNAQKTLLDCFNSLKLQTYQRIKVLMIDDGSTDHSDIICKEIAESDKRFIYLRTDNQGALQARIRGIKEVPYRTLVTFCDSDDMLPKDAIARLVDLILEFNADFACSHQKTVIRSGLKIRKKIPPSISKRKSYDRNQIINEILPSMFGITDFPGYFHSKIFKRELLDCLTVTEFENIFFQEDILFTLLILGKTNKLAVSPDITYLYRTGGATSRFMPDFFKDCIRLYKYKMDYISINNLPDKFKKTTAIELKNEFFTWLGMICRNSTKQEKVYRLGREIDICFKIPQLIEASNYLEDDTSGLLGSNILLMKRDKNRIIDLVVKETNRNKRIRSLKRLLTG